MGGVVESVCRKMKTTVLELKFLKHKKIKIKKNNYKIPVSPSSFSPIIPSPLPSGYCQLVPNFNVFGYILLACSFLLIRFLLKVRLYGICPSLPGLFHLA